MNGRYSNKLLVMIDGRAVYTTTFGGVYRDQIDLPLETIERVEVIRGPGGAVWGANAVNGVIHIITREAAAGGRLANSAGTEGEGRSLVQYGGPAGRRGSIRSYANWTRFASLDGVAGAAWMRSHAGFRGDWQAGHGDMVMVEGGVFVNRGDQLLRSYFVNLPGASCPLRPVRSSGGDLMARWSRVAASGAETAVHAYVDGYHRVDLATEDARTIDFDIQHHFVAGERHDAILAGGFRSVSTWVAGGGPITLVPVRRVERLFSAFAQDEIRLASGIWLTLGSRLERNSYTGFEVEPSVRLAWSPAARYTVWAAVAHAVRQPSRAEAGIRLDMAAFPVAPGIESVIALTGNPGMRSEKLHDLEAGYRVQWGHGLSLDIDGFFSRYRDLASLNSLPPYQELRGDVLRMVAPLRWGNGALATGYGGEATAGRTPAARWRVSAGYANLHMIGSLVPAANPLYHPPTENIAPRHALEFRSFLNLTRRLEWDQWVSARTHLAGGPRTGPKTRLNTRLAWQATERLPVSLVAQNLLHPGYVEFDDNTWIVGARNQRTLAGKVEWSF